MQSAPKIQSKVLIFSMLKIFPPLYPDEIIYSLFARYDTYSGNRRPEDSKEDLFSVTKRSFPYFEMLNRLSYLVDNLPQGFILSSKELIMSHTEFNAYKPFYDVPSDAIPQLMFQGNQKFQLKICPKCYAEQVEKWGEVYTVKYYQNINIWYCYKHCEPLHVKNINFSNRYFYDINCYSINDFICNKLFEKYAQQHIALATNYKKIIDNELSSFTNNSIKDAYNAMLTQKGYKSGELINQHRLYKDFIKVFPKKFLQQVACSISGSKGEWIYNISKKYSQCSPIKHILFITFLFGGVSEFIQFNYKQHIESYNEFFINTVLNCNKRANSLLKALKCSLSVARRKAKQYGIEDIFMNKMKGYFDEEKVASCKAAIKKFVETRTSLPSRKMLSDFLSADYKVVNAWDDKWIDNLLLMKSHSR